MVGCPDMGSAGLAHPLRYQWHGAGGISGKLGWCILYAFPGIREQVGRMPAPQPPSFPSLESSFSTPPIWSF